jgi:hypothetical protein
VCVGGGGMQKRCFEGSLRALRRLNVIDGETAFELGAPSKQTEFFLKKKCQLVFRSKKTAKRIAGN